MKNELERLKLAYQRNLLYLNAILLLGTVGILGFLGSALWDKTFSDTEILITFVVISILLIWGKQSHKNLKNISKEIKNI